MRPVEDQKKMMMVGIGAVAAVGLLAAVGMRGGSPVGKKIDDRQKMTRIGMGIVAVTAGAMTLRSMHSPETSLRSTSNIILALVGVGSVLLVLKLTKFLGGTSISTLPQPTRMNHPDDDDDSDLPDTDLPFSLSRQQYQDSLHTETPLFQSRFSPTGTPLFQTQTQRRSPIAHQQYPTPGRSPIYPIATDRNFKK
jgi:hypothetical protein